VRVGDKNIYEPAHLRLLRDQIGIVNHAGVVRLSMTPALCNLPTQIRQPHISALKLLIYWRTDTARAYVI